MIRRITKSILPKSKVVITALAILCSAVQCSRANSIEVPKPLSNVYDIFGNTNTQRVERQIEYLQFQYPRKQEMISRKDADEAYRRLDSLVSQISDFEQLMRLGYWSKTAHPSPYDSSVAIVEATCGSSLRRIKTLFPKKFQDAVYEMGMLICADGGSGEMIDQLLTGTDKAPEKKLPGVYVGVDGAKDASTPKLLSLHFNLTRLFWSQWKSTWSGKCLFVIRATFDIDSKGKPQNIKLTATRYSKAVTQAAIDAVMPKVRRIIRDNSPYHPSEDGRQQTTVTADFYG